MADIIDARSYLVKMKICNLGCIGPEGVEVSLDGIVCLVGANNSGKSTVLRAYEAAATGAELRPDEVFTKDPVQYPDFVKQSPTVELWTHIPKGAGNVDEKWKQSEDGMLLVQSKWTWPPEGGKVDRVTWDPAIGDYSTEEKASGLDTVFYSRLPRPFRIGSLDDPEDEHKKLLELVLEPIKLQLANLMKEEGSPLREKVKDLQAEAEKPVAAFQSDLDRVQSRVNTTYRRVFSAAEIRLSVSLGELSVDPGSALLKSSHVGIVEAHGQTRWSQQGTGSQRALFWSMLEVRSELNRVAEERKQMEKVAKGIEKEIHKRQSELANLTKEPAKVRKQSEIDALAAKLETLRPAGVPSEAASASFLPGYMLLIDEPETALHPAAIRAAKEYLYSLAAESGWQVMLSTHHPAFIDPLKDHTTIVRLHRPEANSQPNVYRSDTAAFNADEKETLKTLLAFDQSVAEMFFSGKVIVVEGDTEFAAFTVAMDSDLVAYPLDRRPLVLRARGKWTIPLLIRMLTHFKVSCSVLHDIDAPKVAGSGNANGAYGANAEIASAVRAARDSGVHVIHRCSEPDFERQHGMVLPQKNKPFSAWKTVKDNPTVLASVRQALDALCENPTVNGAEHADDGRHYEVKCRAWAAANAATDPEFAFGD